MAYRGSAGYWIAIAFLFIVGAVFFGLWFQRETEILSLRKTLNEAKTGELIDTYKNENVRKQQEEIAARNDRLRILADERDNLQDEVNALEGSLVEERARASRLNREIETLKADLQAQISKGRTLEAKITEVQNRKDENAEKEKQKLRDEFEQANGRLEKLSRNLKRAEEREQNLRTAYQKRIMELQRVNSGLQEVIAKWQKETGREESIKSEQYDGRLLAVDTDNKFVVMNIGRAHNVRRGMRFDVIRWRLNRWDYMGSVEITEVNETTSNGVILDAIVQRKICPVTGYVARDPEEQYSPYAAAGANQDRVVELVRTDEEERASMRELDPIVVGDYITNPFYSKDRKLKFVLAGEPVEYSSNELRQMIERYGGIVQPDIDVDTDYLLLGRIPDESRIAESDEAKKRRERTIKARDMATQYGIPIMREVELFNIIRN